MTDVTRDFSNVYENNGSGRLALQTSYRNSEETTDSELSPATSTSGWMLEVALREREEDRNGVRRREDDRHSYDDEERYAILYLRIVRGQKWAEILRLFNVLFPPGAPRRQADKGLTKTYPQRAKGGLECRYYRLRQDLNIQALRSVGHSSSEDRLALAKLFEASDLSPQFIECLRGL